jgi:hypothetical protein
MRTICDVCESAPAVLFCAADEAALCRPCDEKVNSAPCSLLPAEVVVPLADRPVVLFQLAWRAHGLPSSSRCWSLVVSSLGYPILSHFLHFDDPASVPIHFGSMEFVILLLQIDKFSTNKNGTRNIIAFDSDKIVEVVWVGYEEFRRAYSCNRGSG